MAKTSMSQRVLFPEGKQKKFFETVLKKICVNEIAKLCNVSERTIRDWRRERFSTNLASISTLCDKLKISIPRHIETRSRYWYSKKGASKGGRARFEKYGQVGGDTEYRKKKWFEWWEREGQHKKHPLLLPKSIKKPTRSDALAEFVGIMLGDGGISNYQIVVTLHAFDDREYGDFVTKLIAQLFEVPVRMRRSKRDKAIDYIVSRVELVRFCTEAIGLKKGNKIKQQIDIPEWIKRNDMHSVACLRGLVDTDGCVFTHRYKVGGKVYSYKKLLFTSRSEPLRLSVFHILRNLGINTRLDKGCDVHIDSVNDVKRYFQLVGSHNPKHLKRYGN